MSAPNPNNPTGVTVDQMLTMINTMIETQNNLIMSVNAAIAQQNSQHLQSAQQFADMNKTLIQIDKTVGMGFQASDNKIMPLETARTNHEARIKDLEASQLVNATYLKMARLFFGVFGVSIATACWFVWDSAKVKLPQIEKQVDEIRENMRHDYSERKGKNETR